MRRKLNVLDIDTETLPGHWIGGDFVSKIITAIAWKWVGTKGPVVAYTHYTKESAEMADMIASQIEQADIVTGHYIRGFDLRTINGELLRAGLRSLNQVYAHDTKLDLLSTSGRSLSQKNLAALIGVHKPKVDVTLTEWEGFNTRTPGFEQKGLERVRGDVLQNIEMRERLIEMDWLGPPQTWNPARPSTARYHV